MQLVPDTLSKMTSIVNEGDFKVALHGIYARGVGTTLRSEIAHFFDAEINFCRFR